MANYFRSYSCSESFIQVNGGERICGSRKTQKIWSKCGTEFQVSYYVGTKAYKGFKFFYEGIRYNFYLPVCCRCC